MAMAGLFGTIAGGLLGGLSSVLTNQQNIKLNRENNAANIELAKYNAETSLQNNIKLWNMQNEYNTPSAQMARLRDAGLNPNLAYGSLSAGQAGGISPYNIDQATQHAASVSNPVNQLLQAVSSAQSIMANQAQINQINAQADYTRSNTFLNTYKRLQMLQDISLGKQKLSLGAFDIASRRNELNYQPEYLRLRNAGLNADLELKGLDKVGKLLSNKMSSNELSYQPQYLQLRNSSLARSIMEADLKLELGRLDKQLKQQAIDSGAYELNLNGLGLTGKEHGVLGAIQRLFGNLAINIPENAGRKNWRQELRNRISGKR